MSGFATSIGAGALLLALALAPAPAGEADPGARPEKPKPQAPFEVNPPFGKLVVGDYADRMAAFTDLLPRAAELADAAKAEAARLRALPPPEDGSVARRIMDFVTGCLDALSAEAEIMKSWKKGLLASAEKVGAAGKVVALDCRDKPIAEVLARASAGYGLSIELSPATRIATGALDVDLEGAPTLKQFIGWLETDRGLVCGCSGEKIVLAVPASVKLRENIEKAAKEKEKDKAKKADR